MAAVAECYLRLGTGPHGLNGRLALRLEKGHPI